MSVTMTERMNAVEFKLIIIGDSCAGKSSLLLKLVNDTFTESHKVTIGVDFKAKYVRVDTSVINTGTYGTRNIPVKLKIWDTAGQERFRSIIRTYYHGTHGIVLVFDLTNVESFINLNDWIKEIDKTGNNKVSTILIGNKCDLIEKRVVSQEDVNEFIEKSSLNIKYFECSSKLGTNVNEAFEQLAKQLLTIDFPISESEKITIMSIISEHTEHANSVQIVGEQMSCCVIN